MNQKLVASNIDGEYPLAINISETDGLLLHSKGQLKFNINGLIPSFSSNYSLLYTDQYSTLFQLSDSFFVLVSKDNMTITIFDNTLIEQIPKNTTVFSKAISIERYKYSIISTTRFVITYDTNSYSCVIKNQQLEIDPLNILNGVTDANNLNCDYLKLYNVLVCTYTDNSNRIVFTVYDLATNRVSIPNYLGISFTDAYYPIIKANKNMNTFSLCYYLIASIASIQLKQFNCHKLNVIKENEEFKISTISTFYSNSITQQSLTCHDIKYIQNNFFVIHKSETSLLHNHLSPSNIKISPSKTINDCNDCDYPFLYSFELSVGFVFHSSGKIQIEVYTHPKCPINPVMSTQISSFGSVSINYFFPHYFTFYEYPNNSILLQNKEYINPNTSYSKGEFDYINYHLTGDATWLYSVNTTSVVNSLLCELTILICYNTCSECVQGIYGDSTNHTCKKCIENYYKYSDDKSELGNCISKEEKNHRYYLDGNVFKLCHESCASCLGEKNNDNTNCLSCAETYYPLEEDPRQCRKDNTENYLLSNDFILKRCYESCKTCSEVGFPESHNCIKCKDGYAKGVTNQTYCYTKCDPRMPTNNSDICINSTNPCPEDFSSIYGTNECVKKCSGINNRDCLACQKTIYFKYKFNETSNSFCVENCPKGYAKQYGGGGVDNECIKTGETNGTSDRLKIYIEEKALINFNEVEYNASDINQYLTNLTTLQEEKNFVINLISFVIGNDYSLTYFNVNDEDLKNRVSFNKSKTVSAIDYISFINSINAKNNENTTTVDVTNAIPPIDVNQIFAMQWDIPRPNELTSQVRYKLFNSNGNEYNTRSFQQQPINISYHITNLDDPIIQNAIMLGKLGINMYNASSPFYNDVCFIYQDNITGRDVSVRDRVEAFYPKTDICESSCQLLSIDVDNQKAICQCPFDDSFSNEIVSNKPFPQLNQSNVESYNVVKCVYTAFDKESIVHNVSFWLFLVFIVIIVVLILCFIYSGMAYANSYVSKILKTKATPNPNTVNVYRSNNNNIINHDNDEKLNLSSEQ